MSAAADPNPPSRSETAGFRPARCLLLAGILALSAGVIVLCWYEGLSPTALVERRVALQAFVGDHRVAALAAFTGLYAASVALSLPGASLITICGGFLFGGVTGGVAAMVGATIGATLIFLVAKSALGDWLIRRAGRRVEKVAAGFRADAFNYLLFLRLVPVFPFWLVNLVPAVCGVRLATYVAATALGIIPGTFAFAYFGAGLDSAVAAQLAVYHACVAAGGTDCKMDFDPSVAATPQLIAGLVALGLLSLIPVVVKRLRARAPAETSRHP